MRRSTELWWPKRNDQAIFFGWDGCERDLTVEMIEDGTLPTLARVASTTDTSWINATVTDHTTDTRSGWTQVLTGLCAEVTKVFNNSDWEPIGRPGTIFDVLKTRDAQTATALFSGKAIYSIYPEAGVDYVPPGRRAIRSSSPVYGVPGVPYGDAENLVNLTCQTIEKHADDPFFIFIVFYEIDHAGHRHNHASTEYREAMRMIDDATGQVVSFCEQRDIKPVMLVTTDHGFNKGADHHLHAPEIWAAANAPFKEKGTFYQLDIFPSLLDVSGIDYRALGNRLGCSFIKPIYSVLARYQMWQRNGAT